MSVPHPEACRTFGANNRYIWFLIPKKQDGYAATLKAPHKRSFGNWALLLCSFITKILRIMDSLFALAQFT